MAATRKTAAIEKTSKSKAVVVQANTQVSTDTTPWRDRLIKAAQAAKLQQSKAPSDGGESVSFKGGVITFNGNAVPQLDVVVLVSQYKRTWYDKPWAPGSKEAPTCLSFSGDAPDDASADKQASFCKICPKNAWGSGQNNNGKACKEGFDIIMIDAKAMKSAEALAAAELMRARTSVMNSKIANAYFSARTDDDRGIIPALFVTRITNQADAKTQYKLTFTELAQINAPDAVMDALMARVSEAEKTALVARAPDAPGESPVKAKPAKAKPGITRSRMQ